MAKKPERTSTQILLMAEIVLSMLAMLVIVALSGMRDVAATCREQAREYENPSPPGRGWLAQRVG